MFAGEPYERSAAPAEPESVRAGEGVELRCPEPVEFRNGELRQGHLFAVLLRGQQPTYVQPDNLIELACWACRKRAREAGRDVIRVLHRYDFAGTLIQTLEVVEPSSPGRAGAAPEIPPS